MNKFEINKKEKKSKYTKVNKTIVICNLIQSSTFRFNLVKLLNSKVILLHLLIVQLRLNGLELGWKVTI